MAQEDPLVLLTLAEAAEWAGVTPRTVRSWVDRGHIRARRLGPKLLRIDRATLEAFAREIPGPPSGARRRSA